MLYNYDYTILPRWNHSNSISGGLNLSSSLTRNNSNFQNSVEDYVDNYIGKHKLLCDSGILHNYHIVCVNLGRSFESFKNITGFNFIPQKWTQPFVITTTTSAAYFYINRTIITLSHVTAHYHMQEEFYAVFTWVPKSNWFCINHAIWLA